MLSSSQIKNILIGVLVAYLALDVLLMYATKNRHPGLFAVLMASMKDNNVVVALVVSVAIGFLAWYLASRTECFTTKKE
jgi:hypothetical protein